MPLMNPVPSFAFNVFLFNAKPFGSGGVAGVALGLGSLAVELAQPFITGSFSEVTGLNAEMETEEYREGGRNRGPLKFLKWGKFPNLVLKRGVTFNTDLWDWYHQVLYSSGPPLRKNGIVLLTDRGTGITAAKRGPSPLGLPLLDRLPIAVWYFENGLPEKCQGPNLNAKTNEIAIETLEIAHERIIRLGPAMIPGVGDAVATLGL